MMSDYEELIEKLCMAGRWIKHDDGSEETYLLSVNDCVEIADAIEQLVEERNAAVADIEKYCRYCIVCKNADFTNDYTHNRCRKCLDKDSRYFEWRGVKETEDEAD